MTHRKPFWLRYGAAMLLPVAAAALRLGFFQVMGSRNVYVMFYPAVILAALYGGFWAGLLATALSAGLADFFFVAPLHQFIVADPADWMGMAIFILSSTMISWIAEARVRAQGRARQAELQASVEVARQRDAEAKAFLGAIVESSDDAILSKDLNGTIRSWNAGAEAMLGFRADEIIGQNIALIIPPERLDEEDRIVQRIKRGERVSSYDTVRVIKDGRRVEVSVSVSPLRDSNGQVVGASKIVRDITQRKQKEEQLRLLSSAVESAVNGIAITDRQGRILWVNPAFTRLTGYTLAEAVGANPRVLKSGKHSSEFYARMWATILRGQPWQGEMVNRRKDGSFYTEEMTIAPVRAGSGEVTHFVAIKQDITDRKRDEERTRLLAEAVGQLLQAEAPERIVNELCEKVMAFLDCQAFFNFLVDDQSKRLRLNAWAGISKEEAGKMEWIDFGVAVCGCAARDGCRIVAENIPTTTDPRTELVKSFGIQAYACHPLLAQERVLGTLSFGTRTRARFTEYELGVMKDVADQVAIALERHIAQATLRRTAAELERSNQELQQFAYVASHDLQEPLRAVAGYLSLVEDRFRDKLDDKGRHYISGAIEGAERMHALINDLLELSRVGTRAHAFQTADLNAVLDIALNNLGASIQKSGATITRDPPCRRSAWRPIKWRCCSRT